MGVASDALRRQLLPGGQGKSTPFFPKPNESTRTYSNMLAVDAAAVAAGSVSRQTYLTASREFVAAQLNFLSGARLPNVELQEAFDALSTFLSNTSENSVMSAEQIKAVDAQSSLLARYNSGTLPATYQAPPRC